MYAAIVHYVSSQDRRVGGARDLRDGDGEPCGILCMPSTRERDGAVGVSGMGLLRPMPSESVSPGNDGVDHGLSLIHI